MKYGDLRYIIAVMLALQICFTAFPVQSQVYSEEALQELYGKELLRLPFHIRHQFQKDVGESWPRADYDTRYAFLQKWFAESKDREDRQEKKLRAEARLEEQALREKRNAERAETRKEKEFERRKRAYERAKERRRKEWERRVEEKKKALDELRKRQQRRR